MCPKRDDFVKHAIDSLTDDEKSLLLRRFYEGDVQASAELRQRAQEI